MAEVNDRKMAASDFSICYVRLRVATLSGPSAPALSPRRSRSSAGPRPRPHRPRPAQPVGRRRDGRRSVLQDHHAGTTKTHLLPVRPSNAQAGRQQLGHRQTDDR